MDIQEETSSTPISLPNILNLSVAEELREKFLAHVPTGTDLELDAKDVNTITTPCIQVIIAAGHALEDAGNTIRFHDPSPAFTAAFHDLGLSEFFDRWSTK